MRRLLTTASALTFFRAPGDHCLASVSAVLDERDGWRVVISKPSELHHHIGLGERAYTVPDFFVWEPIPFELFPAIVAVAYRHLKRSTNRPIRSPFAVESPAT